MTFDPKEARALVERLTDGSDRFLKSAHGEQYSGPPVISIPRHRDNIDLLLTEAADTLTAAMAEIERLRAALTLIRDHRDSCHYHDEDMGHALRDFDIEDVRIMEFAARTALKGTGQ